MLSGKYRFKPTKHRIYHTIVSYHPRPSTQPLPLLPDKLPNLKGMTHSHTREIHLQQRNQLLQRPAQNIQTTLISLSVLNKLTQHYTKSVTNRKKKPPNLTQGAPRSANRCPVNSGIHLPFSTCFIIVDAFSNFRSQVMQSIFLLGLGLRAFVFLLVFVCSCSDGEFKPVVKVPNNGIDDFGFGLMFLKGPSQHCDSYGYKGYLPQEQTWP